MSKHMVWARVKTHHLRPSLEALMGFSEQTGNGGFYASIVFDELHEATNFLMERNRVLFAEWAEQVSRENFSAQDWFVWSERHISNHYCLTYDGVTARIDHIEEQEVWDE